MILVHVWNYRGLDTAVGHASMHVGETYISWWPDTQQATPKLPPSLGGNRIFSAKHIHGRTFEQDKRDEESAPHHTIPLDGLDERSILQWWQKFSVPGRLWSTLGQNCSTTVGRALMIGGGDDFALGARGWWHSWNLVWKPDDVLAYAREIRRGLARKGERAKAITLIRRFCRSPLAMTSITLSMDEEGLALALYEELGSDTVSVYRVFEELDERRNTDADDVAELYVNLLRARKGAPLSAVARDEKLKKLLIRILDEGRTSSGEQQCIRFLSGLK